MSEQPRLQAERRVLKTCAALKLPLILPVFTPLRPAPASHDAVFESAIPIALQFRPFTGGENIVVLLDANTDVAPGSDRHRPRV
jgi:hypothetical protein